MKTYNPYILVISIAIIAFGCSSDSEQTATEHDHVEDAAHSGEVVLTDQQFNAMGIRLDSLPLRVVSDFIEATGMLEVPPQYEASVTAVIGANILKIHVIEGDAVQKGQVLATLQHPDLIKMQTAYVKSYSELEYLEQEMNRQQKLYDEKVGSGKTYQQTLANHNAKRGEVSGQAAELQLLGINAEAIRNGELASSVPVRSPIDGFVRMVAVKTGQFVQPQTEMFDIVNISHIHADFMVFEKDIHRVKKGQRVRFTVESMPETEMEAVIYAVGKSFESDPKALHLHAEIEQKEGVLLPGMYVRGQILMGDSTGYALPDAAVVRDGDRHFIFKGHAHSHGDEKEWAFEPVEVVVKSKDKGWTSFEPTIKLKATDRFVWNKAYYLLAEMNRGEGGGGHRH